VSGESSHQHHHFELSIQNYYPIQMHALWLGMFASLVAPFGGFLASAIKRAYGIKDFDSLIPGHGGVMDRTYHLYCTFVLIEMAIVCTFEQYLTFHIFLFGFYDNRNGLSIFDGLVYMGSLQFLRKIFYHICSKVNVYVFIVI
jgi:hypothetical protein